MTELELEQQKSIETFRPPAARFGQPVAFYSNGMKETSRRPELGWVIRTGERTINLYVVSATGGTIVRESVRHVDDPKLQLNSDQRESGAWDFTDYDKEQSEREKYVEKRFLAIENAIINPIKTDRAVLMLTAKRLGLTRYSRISNDEVRAMILAKQAEMGESEPEETEPEGTTDE